MQQTKVEVVAHSLFISAQDPGCTLYKYILVLSVLLHLLQDMEGREWKDEMAFFLNIQ